MDIQNIITLIDAVSKADIMNFEIEEGNFRLSMDKLKERKGGKETVQSIVMPETVTAVRTEIPAVPQVNAVQPASEPAASITAAGGTDNIKEIKSPIVGTFYSASGPDTADFVSPGARVAKGQTLCIIEAMKLMNDIESEYDGEIAEVLVKNEQMVEYGQALFRIKVNG